MPSEASAERPESAFSVLVSVPSAVLISPSMNGLSVTTFVDPAWKDDKTLNVIGNASHLEISKVDTAITGTLAAGRNSLITLGADAAEASSAFEAIASVQGLSWGEKNVTAALYLGAPIEVAGKIVVDGSLTDATSVASTYPDVATIYVANQGILIVSQSQGSSDTSMIAGTLSVADGSYIGVTNATEGTFKLADTITGTTKIVPVKFSASCVIVSLPAVLSSPTRTVPSPSMASTVKVSPPPWR